MGEDCIEIDARRQDGHLCIEVRNRNSTLSTGPGAGAAPGADAGGHGIGLSNTRLRLRELHGDAAQVRLDLLWPQGVACRVRLPWRVLDEPGDADDAAFAAGAGPEIGAEIGPGTGAEAARAWP